MAQKAVLITVLLAAWAAMVAILAARLYSRQVIHDVSDLMEGLQKYVQTTVRGE